MATVNRGEFILGLQPDDRLPNDYLRMVARVFAAYRQIPLEESIVAYIDGFGLTDNGANGDDVSVDIALGTAFVDDQFIGFKEDSNITFDKSQLQEETSYSLVLFYVWVNIFPPREPTFDIIATASIDREQMLELGTVVTHADGTYTLTDYKVSWQAEWRELVTGSTETDGPALLPYMLQIEQDEILDIGWALDFHHHVGNGVDYNTRLHTDRNDDEHLYINTERILTNNDIDVDHLNIIHYLGKFSTPPTTRNDGSALQDGDVYWDTDEKEYLTRKNNAWDGSGSIQEYNFTATQGQNDFIISGIEHTHSAVYVDGIRIHSTEYTTTTDGTDTKIAFSSGRTDGDWVLIEPR